MEETKVIAALKELDKIVSEDEFRTVLKRFTDQHCDKFEDMEVNKHEYNDLYKAFVQLCDDYLMTKLSQRIPGLDTKGFFEALPAHFTNPAARESCGTAAVFEILFSLTDFLSFKDMMVAAKRDKARGPGAQSLDTTMSVSLPPATEGVRAILDGAALLDRDTSFTLVERRSWLEIYRRNATDGKGLVWRVHANVEVPVAAHKLLWGPELRQKWDDSCKEISVVGKEGEFDIMHVVMKFALFPARDVTTKRCITKDWPERGAETIVMVPHAAAGQPKPSGMHMVVVCRPDPTNPNRSRVTSFINNEMPMMPQFVQVLMIQSMLPRMYAKLETGYKKLHAEGKV